MGDARRVVSRRKVITAGLVTGTTFLAGCSKGKGSDTALGTPTIRGNGVFRDVSYDGGNLVVHLNENHRVSRINLIAPDGSLFDRAVVAEGATTVRIEILDIEPNGGGYEHYTPGAHELVAVTEETSESVEIEMVPELRIVDVRQYREGEQANDYGKLAVVIENVGTAPTWVYDAKTKNAPNFAAKVPLGDNPGVLHLEIPKNPQLAIVPPDKRRTFVGPTSPLLFVDSDDPNCVGTHEMSVLVGSPIIDPVEQHIRTKVQGRIKSVGLSGEYVCTNVSVELIE